MKRRYFNLAGMAFVSTIAIGCTKPTTSSSTAMPDEKVTPTSAATPSPSPATASNSPEANKVLRSGTFVDGEHPTRGTARIVQQGEQRLLELDQAFQTSTSGPDLVVVLHRSPNVIGSTVPPAYPINAEDYVVIAPLKSYSGAQSYVIPATIQSDNFASAAIWCRKFNATFGAARLTSS
jgi:hypothetical protein